MLENYDYNISRGFLENRFDSSLSKVFSSIKFQPRVQILDLGCGDGLFSANVIKVLRTNNKKIEVVGVDLEAGLKEAFLENTSKHCLSSEFVAENVETIDLNRKYDLIILSGVQHKIDWFSLLEKISCQARASYKSIFVLINYRQDPFIKKIFGLTCAKGRGLFDMILNDYYKLRLKYECPLTEEEKRKFSLVCMPELTNKKIKNKLIKLNSADEKWTYKYSAECLLRLIKQNMHASFNLNDQAIRSKINGDLQDKYSTFYNHQIKIKANHKIVLYRTRNA